MNVVASYAYGYRGRRLLVPVLYSSWRTLVSGLSRVVWLWQPGCGVWLSVCSLSVRRGSRRALRRVFGRPLSLTEAAISCRPARSTMAACAARRRIGQCRRIFEICSQSHTASRGVLSAGMDQGTASGARHDGRCQSFLDQNVSGAISAQARSCMIVFYR